MSTGRLSTLACRATWAGWGAGIGAQLPCHAMSCRAMPCCDMSLTPLVPRPPPSRSAAVARGVQKVLQDYRNLQDIIAILGMDELSEEVSGTLATFSCVCGKLGCLSRVVGGLLGMGELSEELMAAWCCGSCMFAQPSMLGGGPLLEQGRRLLSMPSCQAMAAARRCCGWLPAINAVASPPSSYAPSSSHPPFIARLQDKMTVARARKIQRFLSQPFAVAEVFTGTPGAAQHGSCPRRSDPRGASNDGWVKCRCTMLPRLAHCCGLLYGLSQPATWSWSACITSGVTSGLPHPSPLLCPTCPSAVPHPSPLACPTCPSPQASTWS